MSSLSTAQPKLVQVDDNVFMATLQLLTNESVLRENKIVRVLTVTMGTSDSLWTQIPRVSGVYYNHINLDEHTSNHIIVFFNQCYRFIREAQNYDENVVVMSRGLESMSVTIIMAFLMKKNRISTIQTLVGLQEKWKVNPNANFIQNLYLWEYMDFRLKADEPLLRRLLIDRFRSKLESTEYFIDQTFDQIKELFVRHCLEYSETKRGIESTDRTLVKGVQYKCGNCGKNIFRELNVVKFEVYFDCKYIYTEPLNWVLGNTYKNASAPQDFEYGQIFCYKCEFLLGVYDWNPSNGCSCVLHRGLERYLNFRFFSNKVIAKNPKTRND